MVHISGHDGSGIPRPQKNFWGFVVVVASVVEISAMGVWYRGKGLTVRADVSNQGCALFGLSLVICKNAANGHRAIRAIKTFMDTGLKGHCVGWFCLALYGADVLSDVPYMYPTNKKALTRLEISACNAW